VGVCRGPDFFDHVWGLYLAASCLTLHFQPTRLLPPSSSHGCPPPPLLLLLGALWTLSSAPAPWDITSGRGAERNPQGAAPPETRPQSHRSHPLQQPGPVTPGTRGWQNQLHVCNNQHFQ